MTASERRNAILEDLCMRRFERINNLAFQYGVTERTIRNDIMILSLVSRQAHATVANWVLKRIKYLLNNWMD